MLLLLARNALVRALRQALLGELATLLQAVELDVLSGSLRLRALSGATLVALVAGVHQFVVAVADGVVPGSQAVVNLLIVILQQIKVLTELIAVLALAVHVATKLLVLILLDIQLAAVGEQTLVFLAVLINLELAILKHSLETVIRQQA